MAEISAQKSFMSSTARSRIPEALARLAHPSE
jgi:hypothetical protein